MYSLTRAKRMGVIMYIMSIVLFIMSFWGFSHGGEWLLRYGFMNDPLAAILMCVFAGLSFVFLFIGLGLKALSKDISEELKHLSSRIKD